MFKKYIIALSLMFGFAFANAEEMMGFSGTFELKYTSAGQEFGNYNAENFSYEARAGWAGDVNSMVHWKVGVMTDVLQRYNSFSIENVYLGEAYVSYMPVDSIYIMAGRMQEMGTDNVLFDPDNFYSGIMAKFHQEMGASKLKIVLALTKFEDGKKGAFKSDTTLTGGIAYMHNMSDIAFKVKVMAMYAGLDAADDATGVETLLLGKAHLTYTQEALPIKIHGLVAVDQKETKNPTYLAGITLGKMNMMMMNKMGKMDMMAQNDWGIDVSYYDVDTTVWNENMLNNEYGVSGTDNGVSVKAQYNVLENTTVSVKYARSLVEGNDDPNSVTGKLAFMF